MHIVLLNDDALPEAKGGAAVIVDHLRRGYTEAGHKVTLITTHQDQSHEREERRKDSYGDIISIQVFYPLQRRHRLCLQNPNVTPLLEKLFDELKPDVVHVHNVHTYLTYESLRIARKHTEKVFLTAHDTFLVSFDRIRGAAYEKAALDGNPFHIP